MADIVDIKCAKCDVPLQGAATDPQPTDMVSCPKCGVSDSLENVIREVGEYVEEKTAEYLAGEMRDATRGSKTMTFKEKPRPKKTYRFIMDLDL